jgi:DNA primase
MIDLRLAVTDQVIGDRPLHIPCRSHKERTASLAVYPDHLYCYGCHFTLQGLDGLAYLLGKSAEETTEVAAYYTNEHLNGYRERVAQESRRDPLPLALSAAYHRLLMEGPRRDRRAWFEGRGLHEDTLNEFQLGHTGLAFTIPIFDDRGHLLALRYRRDDTFGESGPRYWGDRGRNGRYLFPQPQLARLLSFDCEVYLCEGELDAIRLWQAGCPAVAVPNGAGELPRVPALIRQHYPHIDRLILCADQDGPGQEAAALTCEAAVRVGYPSPTVLRWPLDKGKDITEFLLNGGDLKGLTP